MAKVSVMKQIRIGDKPVGSGNPCYIIAEAGVNHNGSVELAKKLVDAAVDAGCDAVKFQAFSAENLVTKNAQMAGYQKDNLGKKQTQYELIKGLELPGKDFYALKGYCDKKGIFFMCTPHSGNDDIDLVADISPAIKMGSGDLTNLPALEYAAKKGKPMILGTGMSDLDEVKEAVAAVSRFNKDIILLHCTTNYPTRFEDVNLTSMLTMRDELNVLVGYSDHTPGTLVPPLAVAMGACVIEKHFTLDRAMPGPDHKASLEPSELKEMVEKIRQAEKIMGSSLKKPVKGEIEIAKVARKSIFASVDLKKGEKIKREMLAIKRPGTGLKPKYLESLIGRRTKRAIKLDESITLEDLE